MDVLNEKSLEFIGRGDVDFRKNSRARRYVARVNEQGRIVLTIPTRGTQKEALAFANLHSEWLRDQQREVSNTIANKKPLSDGDMVMLAGEWHRLTITKNRGRPILNVGPLSAYIADESSDHRRSLPELFRTEAKRLFPDRMRELAERFGIEFKRVSIRGQKTRWGSCSSSGTISLNWKLVQAPLWVRDYVFIHELMHVKEMNHSHRFWSLVAEAFPNYKEAISWLGENEKWMKWDQ